jgi:chloramphenicol-sensitive protein RarD
LLQPSGAFEIVGLRILFAGVLRDHHHCHAQVAALSRDPASAANLLSPRGSRCGLHLPQLAVYAFATLDGKVMAASLGYFINPIVTVLFRRDLLREQFANCPVDRVAGK